MAFSDVEAGRYVAEDEAKDEEVGDRAQDERLLRRDAIVGAADGNGLRARTKGYRDEKSDVSGALSRLVRCAM